MIHKSQFQLSRVIEFDALRIIALGFILYTHSGAYISINSSFRSFFNSLFPNPGGAGLSIFVFLSGFGLYASVLNRNLNDFSVVNFLKRRLIRIYPLYLLAIFSYFLVFNILKIYHRIDVQPLFRAIVGHVMFLQILLYPKIAQMITIWFLGMIVPFYVLFALTVKLQTRKFIIAQILIFFSVVLVKAILEINSIELIDMRFIFYYPIFIAGCVVAAYAKLFYNNRKYLKLASFLTIILYAGFIFFLENLTDYQTPPDLGLTLVDVRNTLYLIIYTFLITALFICALFVVSNIINQQKPWILYLSTLSYAAYLFHRIVYALSYFVINNTLNLSPLLATVLFIPVTIFLFWIADRLVVLETSIVNHFKKTS